MKRVSITKPFKTLFNEEAERLGYKFRLYWKYSELFDELDFYGDIGIQVPETNIFKRLFNKFKFQDLAVFEVEGDKIYLSFTTKDDKLIGQIETCLLFAEEKNNTYSVVIHEE